MTTSTAPRIDPTALDKRVALLLSGGVDSAVAAYLLCRSGIRPDCFYIKIGPQETESWDCTSEEDMEMAAAVAAKYSLKLEEVDCHKEYWAQVAKYTMETVRAGLTPNPDVMCNRLIKFGAFDDKRGAQYDLIATGHYATTETDVEGRKWLCTSPDPVKDQTDFLARLFPWQLNKALFPVGHLTKEDVRRIAEREKLINARRKDSQGICFLGRINYNDYIRTYVGERPGDVVERETGRKIGTHKGLWFHTVGQRKGLGLGGGPWFTVGKDLERNILYVSKGYNPDDVYRRDFAVNDLRYLTAPLVFSPDRTAEITFKIRHTSEYYTAVLEDTGGGTYVVHSDFTLHGVAGGQFCVVYDRAHHRCYGSAVIAPQPF
ncbi:MAG: tRNA 2-thiouridine(34) synthase MnmA [Prevotella sp.]|nr:tRNA 2-thiouridine(34) synthase MnmA [Prevotella sp.]